MEYLGGSPVTSSVVIAALSGQDLGVRSLTLSGNISAAAWTTSGIGLRNSARTITDTTSSGTVAAAYTNALGGNTVAASNATTFTTYCSLYLSAPVAGTNVTITNPYALGLGGPLLIEKGTITTSRPSVVTETWNAGGVTFVAQSIDITDTASAADSSYFRIRRNGSDWVRVQKGTIAAYVNYPYISSGTNAYRGAVWLLEGGIGISRLSASGAATYIGADISTGLSGTIAVAANSAGGYRGKIGFVAADPFQNEPNPYFGRAAPGIFSVHSTSDTVGGSLAYPAGASNTTVTGTVNNLALDASAFQRLTGSSTPVVTGIAPPSGGGHADGNERRIYNVGATAIQFNHNDAGSTAANRLFFQGAANVSVAQNECLLIQYDATNNGSGAAGWRARKLSN